MKKKLESIKVLLKKIFYPSTKIVVGGALFIAGSLFYLIYFHRFGATESYLLYFIQSYCLIIVCIKIYDLFNHILDKIMTKNKYLMQYKSDYLLRYKVSLFTSFTLNILYVLFKFISGIIYQSLWFISFAIYYLVLVITRLHLVIETLKPQKNLIDEYRKYRFSAITLLFINLFLAMIIVIIVKGGFEAHYTQVIAISIASYTFYLLVTSIVNLIRYRKLKSPLITASKITNVVTSLVSMLSLEVVMLNTFSAEKEVYNNRMIMATGGGLCLIISVISIIMIVKATKYLKSQKSQS